MKLVELVIDILDHSETPLKQGEILSIAEQREDYAQCRELQEVKVPLSAVARCLTKYSSGSNPVFGVAFEGKNKQSQKRFFLKTKDIPEVKLRAKGVKEKRQDREMDKPRHCGHKSDYSQSKSSVSERG